MNATQAAPMPMPRPSRRFFARSGTRLLIAAAFLSSFPQAANKATEAALLHEQAMLIRQIEQSNAIVREQGAELAALLLQYLKLQEAAQKRLDSLQQREDEGRKQADGMRKKYKLPPEQPAGVYNL